MDSYLRRQYDISLEERNAILKEQDNLCACCGRLFDGHTRMEVDHEHFKIRSRRSNERDIDPKGWYATAYNKSGTIEYTNWAKTKKQAEKLAKRAALRGSVRGILCGGRYAGCNRKIGRIDDIGWMMRVVEYLKNPPARRVLKETTP
jgi:hypothetical protein